jgi:hypothetical protein
MTDHLISTMLNASETDNACARCRGICIPIPMGGWQYDHNSIQQTLEGRQNGCSFCSLLTLALGLNPGPGTIAMKAWKDEITPSTTQNYDYYFEARVHSLSDTSSHSPTRATFKLNPLLGTHPRRPAATSINEELNLTDGEQTAMAHVPRRSVLYQIQTRWKLLEGLGIG